MRMNVEQHEVEEVEEEEEDEVATKEEESPRTDLMRDNSKGIKKVMCLMEDHLLILGLTFKALLRVISFSDSD